MGSTTLIDLPVYICEHIITFIDDTITYKNLRLSCSFFYYLMQTIKTFYYQSKKLHKIINFKHGTIHGEYISFYENNNVFKKFNYYYGVKQGICNIYYRSGKLKNSSNYKYGFKNGIETNYFLNGGISSIINYKSNHKYKSELSNNIDGSLNYIVRYQTSTKYQLTIFLLNNKLLITFDNGYIHGQIAVLNRSNNILQISDFVKNNLHGIQKSFCNNNTDSLIHYQNGERNGIAYFWKKKRIQKMCHYKDNMLHGILKYWDEEINIESFYNYNSLQYTMYLIDNNKMKLEFSDNKPHGYFIEYLYDTIVRTRIKFSYGNFDKIYKKYYYTGEIKYEYFYNNHNEVMITNYDIYGKIKYKLIKKNNMYTIYHKFADETLIYEC